MYAFYERQISKALEEDNVELAQHLIADAPKEVKKALIRNDIIEGSVEETREKHYLVTIRYVYEVLEHDEVSCTEDEIEEYANKAYHHAQLPEDMNNDYILYVDYEYNELPNA